MMSHSIHYTEVVTSRKTTLLFIALTLLFLILSLAGLLTTGFNFLSGLFLFFFIFFLFYTINYRTLVIHLTAEYLVLTFGLIKWRIPLNNILDCQPDENLPLLMKYGGAGIHFMFIKKRYRASFNFLEHPRVVIRLKRKAGLVRDVSFTTCNPNELIQQIQHPISMIQTH